MTKTHPSKLPALTPTPKGTAVDWKLLFNQLFALEIKKEHVLPGRQRNAAAELDALLRAYTQYTPLDFNDAIEQISAAGSSSKAYEARLAFFEDPLQRRLISELDLRSCLSDELRACPTIRSFLDVLWSHKERPIAEGENFFESEEGQNVARAMTVDGDEDCQEAVLIFVHGYAGHTVKYTLFEEIVRDANLFHGREPLRPLLHEEGIDLEFEDHKTYYGSGDGGAGSFDILQPVGKELGNTTGANAGTTDHLHDWICSLPEGYADKKLIFLGYSKGAPIILDLVARHPELSPRILGYVSFAGVLQGTQVARLAADQAGSILRDVPISEFIATLRSEEPARLGQILSPLFSDIDLSWLSVPRIRAVFDVLGYDVTPLEQQLDRVLEGREVSEMLDGAADLSPLERTRWNLSCLRDDVFKDPAFLFQLSAVTDVQDFVRPVGLRAKDPESHSLLAPVLNAEGTLDWKHFSLDALFLYATSIEGFRCAPAGLFDAQVELSNTKAPVKDRRPLADTLDDADLLTLWQSEELKPLWERHNIGSAEELGATPRKELFPAEERTNLDVVDLGEFKGHHWTPFVQALRPPPELSAEHASWDFPRKAFMRALLQLVALHNLTRHADLCGVAEEPKKASIVPAPAEEYRDVVFFRSTGAGQTRRQLLNLYNLGARAVSYGIVVNSARSGLGTSPPAGPALTTESLYYQALRLYSAADAEFKRGLLKDPTVWPLPRSLALMVSRFPGSFAGSYPEEPNERLAEIHRALKVLNPALKPFELRLLAPGDYVTRQRSRTVTFSESIRDNLWRGTRARIQDMERNAYDRVDGVPLEAKLEAMLTAFAPLCTVLSAAFDPDAPEQSSTRLTVYLPPFHSLRAEDLDNPASWYLDKGLDNLRLHRPVQLIGGEITHVRLHHEAEPGKTQAIKLEVHCDYADHDRITTEASFGKLFEPNGDDLYGFDTSDPRDALHIVVRPRIPVERGDTPGDRRRKEAFNKVFENFEIEARIHKLTLKMRRKGRSEDALLRPSFVLADSSISFRASSYVDTTVEHLPLQAAGFTCREVVGGGKGRFHCWRDFSTWDHLRDEFFLGRSGGGRLKLPSQLRGKIFEQLLGNRTKLVVDRSIETIEDALDKEIALFVDTSLKRYSKARTVLFDRLHDGLFDKGE